MWLTFFCISACVNVLFLFYLRWLLVAIKIRDEELANVTFNIKQFNNHLSEVHELEMFYGDETLTSLIEHSKQVKSSLEELVFIVEQDLETQEAEIGGLDEEKTST